jgi:ureidoacrylate peracid hydrolase
MDKITRRDFVAISAAGGLTVLGARNTRAKSPPKRTTIEARPESITLDSTRTAVIVVDMQNDFGSEGGMFQRAGINISPIRAAVAPTAKALSAARKAKMRIVYLKMAFQPDLSDAGSPGSPTRRNH